MLAVDGRQSKKVYDVGFSHCDFQVSPYYIKEEGLDEELGLSVDERERDRDRESGNQF